MISSIAPLFSSRKKEDDIHTVYISESSNLRGRVGLHCKGTVQDSILREKIALRLGYGILKKLQTGTGTVVKSIHAEDPLYAEDEVSAFIRHGHWKIVRTDERVVIADFRNYLVDKLKPTLNERGKSWDRSMESAYKGLQEALQDSRPFRCSEYELLAELPGIYLFLHPDGF